MQKYIYIYEYIFLRTHIHYYIYITEFKYTYILRIYFEKGRYFGHHAMRVQIVGKIIVCCALGCVLGQKGALSKHQRMLLELVTALACISP